MMNQGRAQAFGPRDEVLARVLQRDGAAAARSLKVVPEAGAASHDDAEPNGTSRRSIAATSLAGLVIVDRAGRRRRRLGRHHDAVRRADRPGLRRRRFQRQEGPASDRRHRRRAPRARRRPGQAGRHRGSSRRHGHARQSGHRHQGPRRALRPQGAPRKRARRRAHGHVSGRSPGPRRTIPMSPRSSMASASCSNCAAPRAPARRRSFASGSSSSTRRFAASRPAANPRKRKPS